MKLILVVLIFAASGVVAAPAEPPVKAPADAKAQPDAKASAEGKSPKSQWFKNWKQGLEHNAVSGHYRKVRSFQVAATRGLKQEGDPRAPYWKDTVSKEAEANARSERKELSIVADLAAEGKDEEARKALDAFEANHPKSPLLADVRAARGQLPPASMAPAPAPAVKTP